MNIQCFFQFQNISPLLGNPLHIMETKKIMKLNTEITLKSKEKETRNNNKDETRIINIKNKITLDVNYKIHRMDRDSNRDTLMAIQDICTIILEFKRHIHRLEVTGNSKIIKD